MGGPLKFAKQPTGRQRSAFVSSIPKDSRDARKAHDSSDGLWISVERISAAEAGRISRRSNWRRHFQSFFSKMQMPALTLARWILYTTVEIKRRDEIGVDRIKSVTDWILKHRADALLTWHFCLQSERNKSVTSHKSVLTLSLHIAPSDFVTFS
jgi:hypothetical protein